MASDVMLELDWDPMDTAERIPHDVYARLRREQPISKTSTGAWAPSATSPPSQLLPDELMTRAIGKPTDSVAYLNHPEDEPPEDALPRRRVAKLVSPS